MIIIILTDVIVITIFVSIIEWVYVCAMYTFFGIQRSAQSNNATKRMSRVVL